MNRHPTAEIDEIDRAAGRREGFWRGIWTGIALSFGAISAAVFWGVI